MKIFKTTVLFLTISIFFIPQSISRTSRSYLKVKSAFVHSINVPVANTELKPSFPAKAIYVLDLESDTVLYQKNSLEPLSPASLTKIMTALVALDSYQVDQVLVIKSADHSIGNTMSLKPGDSLTAIDLIYGLMVPSGNDAALALAENYPGGYSQFVAAMNQKVRDLNLESTHFNNVSGIEGVDHFSTAKDLTRLTQVALGNATFRQVVATKQKEITSIRGNRYNLISTNKLLGVLPNVQGVKTGWTPEAGECLITLIYQDGHPVVITVMGSEDRFGETEQIINWVDQNFSWE